MNTIVLSRCFRPTELSALLMLHMGSSRPLSLSLQICLVRYISVSRSGHISNNLSSISTVRQTFRQHQLSSQQFRKSFSWLMSYIGYCRSVLKRVMLQSWLLRISNTDRVCHPRGTVFTYLLTCLLFDNFKTENIRLHNTFICQVSNISKETLIPRSISWGTTSKAAGFADLVMKMFLPLVQVVRLFPEVNVIWLSCLNIESFNVMHSSSTLPITKLPELSEHDLILLVYSQQHTYTLHLILVVRYPK